MIKSCNCKHKFQDKEYGQGNRVFNPKEKIKDKTQEYRCTVCQSIKT